MAVAKERLKLLNDRTGRLETLPEGESLGVYVALPAGLWPGSEREPAPSDFASLLDLRIFCVADLALRLLDREGRKVRLEATPAMAGLVVEGSGQENEGGKGVA